MFRRAQILKYDPKTRTAQVHIHGLTDGASEGLTATFAYAIGEDDRDTEIQIMLEGLKSDVYVFFENGDQARPVIMASCSHGQDVIEDVRRIRQKNIELIAAEGIQLKAPDVTVIGKLHVTEGITTDGDVVASNISLIKHRTSGVRGGSEFSGPPTP